MAHIIKYIFLAYIDQHAFMAFLSSHGIRQKKKIKRTREKYVAKEIVIDTHRFLRKSLSNGIFVSALPFIASPIHQHKISAQTINSSYTTNKDGAHRIYARARAARPQLTT